MSLIRSTAALALGVLLALPTASAAWSPESQRAIAFDAARLAPPDLYRQLRRNRESFRIGVDEPFQHDAQHRQQNPDGSGMLQGTAISAVENAVRAIEAHRPFNEIAYRLGLVAHYLAAVNDPLACDDGDPLEARFADDFRHYVESARPRLRRVFYGFRPETDRERLQQMVAEALDRGRRLYPLIGREYRRVELRSGVEAFDDRSTAFAVAALGYSHAVSDVAEALRLIWLAAGGADDRARLPMKGHHVLPLPPFSDAP